LPTVPIYTNQVQQQTLPSFRVQSTAPTEAFGGGLGQTISNIGQEAFNMQQQEQARLNQIAVANATSNTQKVLTPLQNDLLTKMGTNALGTVETKDNPSTPAISQDFQKQSDNIYKTTYDSLSNETQKTQYKQWYDSIHIGMYQSVLNHEKKQIEVAHTVANESQLNSNSEAFTSNVLMGNYAQANNSLRSGIVLSDSMGSINGVPKETQDENHNKYIYGNIGKTVDILIANNRPEDAKKLIDYYGDKLPEAQKAINMSKINPSLEKNETDTYVESLKKDPTMINPDGTPNAIAMNAAAEVKYRNRTRTVTKPGTPGVPGADSMYNAAKIVSQQTGIPTDFIYGQMYHESGGFNSQLARENFNFAGLTQNEPNGIENKQPDGSNYYKQYSSVEEFAKDYGKFLNNYKGLSGAKSPAEYAKLLHDQGYYVEDPNQKTPEQAVNDYTAGLNSGISNIGTGTGGTTGTPTTYEQVPSPDLIGLQLAKARIAQVVAEGNAQHKQMIDNNMYQFDQWLTQTKPTTVSAIQAQAQSMGFQGPDLINAIAKGKQYAGLLKVEENENSAVLFEEALGKMYNGEITTKGELDSQYGGSLPYSKLITLGNSLKRETKWATTENLMAFNGVIKDKGIKSGTEKTKIYEKINQHVAENMSKGIPITSQDITDWAQEQTQKVILSRNYISKNETIDTAFIPSVWNITSEGVFTPEGIQITKSKDGKFYTTKNGVDIEVQP
jgi:hypothetical protein